MTNNQKMGVVGAFVVNFVTLIGILFLIPCMKCRKPSVEVNFLICTLSFSSGCILATAFLLVLPEAMHIIDNGPEALWGTFILTGFITPYIISLFSPTTELVNRNRIIYGCLLGDAFHNFADGVFIGSVFIKCKSFGWIVVASSVLHEIAQESSDFLILTGPGNLSPFKALCLNFLSGLSCPLGAVFIAYDMVPDVVVGYVLALGGGVYIQLGASECFPRAIENASTMKLKLTVMFFFLLGAIPVGLVLLMHEHC